MKKAYILTAEPSDAGAWLTQMRDEVAQGYAIFVHLLDEAVVLCQGEVWVELVSVTPRVSLCALALQRRNMEAPTEAVLGGLATVGALIEGCDVWECPI